MPLDERFFIWLVRQVVDTEEKDPSKTYWKLLKLLYTKEFDWFIPMDDNRVEDGKILRLEFIREENLHYVDPSWMDLGCSMLELMVGLSRRLSFEAEREPRYWFWVLMENLGIDRYNDRRRINRERIIDILVKVIYRQYDPDGFGGFFPLKYPEEDQRDVELWYQMSKYVLERS